MGGWGLRLEVKWGFRAENGVSGLQKLYDGKGIWASKRLVICWEVGKRIEFQATKSAKSGIETREAGNWGDDLITNDDDACASLV